MIGTSNRPPARILIASANPLFSRGLQKLLADRWSGSVPEMRLAGSTPATLTALESWSPDLVVVDYDDQNINRAEVLTHFLAGVAPMQVVLVSLQASGEVVVYDRRTLTADQARDWFEHDPTIGPAAAPTRRAAFLTWRWLLATLLVLSAVVVFIRLGFWQLDRLAQRRALNARISAQVGQPVVDLNQAGLDPADLAQMEYREAVVTGVFDPSGEIVLRNRTWQNRLGVHILTPLKIDGSGAVILVDRGWIPFEQAGAADRAQYKVSGAVTVRGMLRAGESKPTYVAASPTLAAGQTFLDAWNYLDLPAITSQAPDGMLPVYLQEAPGETETRLPYRSLPEIDLTEGPHLGYALQWFFFALILIIGYPIFVRRQLSTHQQQRTLSEAVRDE